MNGLKSLHEVIRIFLKAHEEESDITTVSNLPVNPIDAYQLGIRNGKLRTFRFIDKIITRYFENIQD